mmetsp:Transcript_21136/g.53290  ORF Transcript_21136/g.53290 Transcript_21136/m.53290 type:complete len:239 (+) Transcript_21136:575-1291(+)
MSSSTNRTLFPPLSSASDSRPRICGTAPFGDTATNTGTASLFSSVVVFSPSFFIAYSATRLASRLFSVAGSAASSRKSSKHGSEFIRSSGTDRFPIFAAPEFGFVLATPARPDPLLDAPPEAARLCNLRLAASAKFGADRPSCRAECRWRARKNRPQCSSTLYRTSVRTTYLTPRSTLLPSCSGDQGCCPCQKHRMPPFFGRTETFTSSAALSASGAAGVSNIVSLPPTPISASCLTS